LIGAKSPLVKSGSGNSGKVALCFGLSVTHDSNSPDVLGTNLDTSSCFMLKPKKIKYNIEKILSRSLVEMSGKHMRDMRIPGLEFLFVLSVVNVDLSGWRRFHKKVLTTMS
jgi:hypothetical protein